VFGGSGFVARGVCNRLGKNGSQMILPYRGEHYKMMRLKVAGDLGQVLFCPIELRDEDSIRRAVSHSNIVINLIGRGWETSNFSYNDVNVTGPQTIARICKEAGVQRLVHLSHINARENPEKAFLPGGSNFLRSKWEGEQAILQEFPNATIFRCADVYGHGDSFVNYWMSRFRRTGTINVPLYGKGLLTVKQPVWMTDLVSGIMNSLHDPQALGQIYEAVGSQRITQNELITYMYGLVTRLQAEGTFNVSELMMSPTMLTRQWLLGKLWWGNGTTFANSSLDRLERDALSDTSEGHLDLTDLGVKLHTLEQRMPFEVCTLDLYKYYFYEEPEELPVKPLPKILNMEEERALIRKREMGVMGLIPGLV